MTQTAGSVIGAVLGILIVVVAMSVIGRVRARRTRHRVAVEGDVAPRPAAYRVPGSSSSHRWRHGWLAVDRDSDLVTWTSRGSGGGNPVVLAPLVITGDREQKRSERFWRLHRGLTVVQATCGVTAVELAVFDEGLTLLRRRSGEGVRQVG